jgi:hypothetical protein
LAGDVEAALAARGVEVMAYQPRPGGLRSV